MKNFLKRCAAFLVVAFQYVAASWEGDDGKFSYKRASQFVFIFLADWLVIKDQVQTQYGFYSLVTLCVTFLLLASIITVQQIISCMQELNKLKKTTE